MAFYGRGKNKVQNPYVLKDMYKEYIKDKKEGTPYHISYSTYVKLCGKYYKDLADYINKGGFYILPYRMGEISVGKIMPSKFKFETVSLDWKSSAELGKQVYHINDHTGYYKYRYHWSKKKAYFSNKSKYRMVFTRDNKRELARIIKTGEYDYFEL